MPEISDGLLYFIKYPFLILIYIFLLLTLRIMIGSLSLRSISKDFKNSAYIDEAPSHNSYDMSQEPTVVNLPIPEQISNARPCSAHQDKSRTPENAKKHYAPVPSPEEVSIIPDAQDENVLPQGQAKKDYGYLEVLSGQIAGNKERIAVTGPITFGRSKEADVRLKDLFSSALNTELLITPQGAVLKDLDSRNGTFCNDKRIDGKILLHDGDVFAVGEATFRWHKL